MIHAATYNDEGRLRELWKTVFGDSDRFLDLFFGNLFHPGECLVTRSGEEITAMLFMLEGVLSCRSDERPMRYVYACATHPDHRRQGLMGRLLTEAAGYAGEMGFELALVPEDHLFDYYGRFGFTERTCFHLRRYPARATAKEGTMWRTAGNVDAVRLLYDLRQRFWWGRNAVLWPHAHLKVALDELFFRGGELVVVKGGGLPDGYALALPEDGTIKIVECASVMPQDDMVNSLRDHYKTLPTLFSLAGGVCGSCAQTPYALFHTRAGAPPPYLNLALDL